MTRRVQFSSPEKKRMTIALRGTNMSICPRQDQGSRE